MDADTDLAVRDLANAPEYCRATGDLLPSFGNPVSSTTHAAGQDLHEER